MSRDRQQDLELVDYTCAAQNRPDDLAARMTLVGALHRRGQTDRAIDELDAMDGQFPDEPQVHAARAKILARESRWVEAVAACHAAIEAGEHTCEIYHSLGLAHLNADEIKGFGRNNTRRTGIFFLRPCRADSIDSEEQNGKTA